MRSKFGMEINSSVSELPESIKAKVLARAKRYFEGKNIHHRVVSKDDNSITFKFNRMTCKYPIPVGTVVTVVKVSATKKAAKAPKSPATKKPAVKKAAKAPKAPKSPATKKPAVKKAAKAPKAPKSPATKKPAVKKAAKATKSPSTKDGSNLKVRKFFDWSPV
jgi:hypothetical protein